ncbi:MAG: YggT family protein [Burkholderiaceae bacterium]|nr:YggT family protein [Burkholderiaceae bacterium]
MLLDFVNLIVDTAATLMAAVFLLRFWSQVARVRPPDSLVRFTMKVTNWLVLPLRRIVPGFGGLDWPCLIGAFLMAILAAIAATWTTPFFQTKFVLLLSLQQLMNWFIYGLMGLMVLEVIYSWINPNSPLMPFVQEMNAPLLNPLRRLIPPIGGIDLTILVALILLRVALQLVGLGISALA